MATSATAALSPQDYFATTLSSGITLSDTTIFLSSLPTATEGFLVIDPDNSSKEIIFYNAKGSNFVTVPSTGDRGRGGTSAVAHSSSAVVKMMVVAEYFTEVQNGHALSLNLSTLGGLTNPYKFSAYKTTTQSAIATTTKVTWDTELFDSNSNFASSTYTAPVSGFYWFKASLYISGSTTFAYVALYKNGTLFTPGDAQSSSSSGDVTVSVNELLQLTAGDTIDTRIGFTGGGTRDVVGVTGVAVGTTGFSKFQGILVTKL